MALTKSSKFYDNTTISAYKDCPRKYQLRHKLNLVADSTSLPLAFGLAWHAGMDEIWRLAKHIPDQDKVADLATVAFLEVWEAEGLNPHPDLEELERLSPRTPAVAREMFRNYVVARQEMLHEAEVLGSEQPFAVPIPETEDTWYAGRLDKVIRWRGETVVLEHKTTSEYKREGGFRATYVESWFTDSQVKGYQFGGSLFYPELTQVWVDAALVHKQVHDAFRLIPVAHQPPLLMEWLQDTRNWIARIEADNRAGYFPKNENSCMGKYGPCPFLTICRTTADPTTLGEAPPGYKQNQWEPFKYLKLEKIAK